MNKEYTGCNHILGDGIHIAMGNPSFTLIVEGKKYLTEWHHYFGPSVMTKRGYEAHNQPNKGHPWWMAAQWWYDQGGRVVDGIGIYDVREIEVIKAQCRNGDFVEIEFWKGYLQHGPITYRQRRAFIGVDNGELTWKIT